jgi:hypothetical protein
MFCAVDLVESPRLQKLEPALRRIRRQCQSLQVADAETKYH